MINIGSYVAAREFIQEHNKRAMSLLITAPMAAFSRRVSWNGYTFLAAEEWTLKDGADANNRTKVRQRGEQ